MNSVHIQLENSIFKKNKQKIEKRTCEKINARPTNFLYIILYHREQK